MAIELNKREKEGSPKTPARTFSKKQEIQIARELGGSRNPNSGATPFMPGDVRVPNLFLIECKTKMSPSESISIKKSWIERVKQEALFSGEPHSCVAFNFGPDEENYYIIDQFLFQTLIEYLKNPKEM